MTPIPPPDPDEVASLLLDGQLDPDEAAAAERDPAVRRCLDAQLAARATLRASADGDPRSPTERDATIAQALEAFDAPRPHRLTRWLSAAAAVALLAGLAALVSRTPANRDDETAAQTSAAYEQPEQADESAQAEVWAQAEESPPTTEAKSVDLGAVASTDELVERARAMGPADGAAHDGDEGDPGPLSDSTLDTSSCEAARSTAQGPLALDATTPALRAVAVLGGAPVEVWLYARDDRERVIAITEDCTVLLDRVVDP